MRDRIREGIFNLFRRNEGNRFTILLLAFWIIFCLTLTANAGLVGYYPGNDKKGVVANIVGKDVALIGKIETNGNTLKYEGDGDHFKLDYYAVPSYKGWHYNYYLLNSAQKGGLFMSGSVSQIGDDFDVDYFTAKAGKGFNLYEWEDDLEFQEWFTYNTCADLSHVSFYGAAVPEPSSFIMLGTLALGLLVVKGVSFVRSR